MAYMRYIMLSRVKKTGKFSVPSLSVFNNRRIGLQHQQLLKLKVRQTVLVPSQNQAINIEEALEWCGSGERCIVVHEG